MSWMSHCPKFQYCLLLLVSIVVLTVIPWYNNVNMQINFSKMLTRESQPLILLYTHNHSRKTRDYICRGIRNGGHLIDFRSCPKQCQFSCRREDLHRPDTLAVLFFGEDFYWSFHLSDQNRTSRKQRWIFWSWEAPIHHPEYTRSSLTFNWTMTYRQDSDIVHSYGRYIVRNASKTIRDRQTVDPYLSPHDNRSTFNVTEEFHRRKNRMLWFVSNCHSRSRRDVLAKALSQLFPLDQFGACGSANKTQEFETILVQYKFYLAFENAHCQDYLTEKTFYNALTHGSIPIIFGPTEENVRRLIPPDSYLHIDENSNLTRLAETLNDISRNRSRFEFYHRWREEYRLITWKSNYQLDDRFCDLCMKLHSDSEERIYSNFSTWLNRCRANHPHSLFPLH